MFPRKSCSQYIVAQKLDVVIVDARIGGLQTGLALARDGHKITLNIISQLLLNFLLSL
jgi:hypothetical protein